MALPEDATRSFPYDIQRQVGQGAMGEVYLARETNLDRKVAIERPQRFYATGEQRLITYRPSPKPTRQRRVGVSIGTHTSIKEQHCPATPRSSPEHDSLLRVCGSTGEQHCPAPPRSSPKPTRHRRVGVSIGEVGVGAVQPTVGGASTAIKQIPGDRCFAPTLPKAGTLPSPAR